MEETVDDDHTVEEDGRGRFVPRTHSRGSARATRIHGGRCTAALPLCGRVPRGPVLRVAGASAPLVSAGNRTCDSRVTNRPLSHSRRRASRARDRSRRPSTAFLCPFAAPRTWVPASPRAARTEASTRSRTCVVLFVVVFLVVLSPPRVLEMPNSPRRAARAQLQVFHVDVRDRSPAHPWEARSLLLAVNSVARSREVRRTRSPDRVARSGPSLTPTCVRLRKLLPIDSWL